MRRDRRTRTGGRAGRGVHRDAVPPPSATDTGSLRRRTGRLRQGRRGCLPVPHAVHPERTDTVGVSPHRGGGKQQRCGGGPLRSRGPFGRTGAGTRGDRSATRLRGDRRGLAGQCRSVQGGRSRLAALGTEASVRAGRDHGREVRSRASRPGTVGEDGPRSARPGPRREDCRTRAGPTSACRDTRSRPCDREGGGRRAGRVRCRARCALRDRTCSRVATGTEVGGGSAAPHTRG